MKTWRSSTAVLVLSLLVISYTDAAPVDVDMTFSTWVISATDNSGLSWDGSTITFESQVADGDVWNLGGIFQWIGSNGASGGEKFSGTLEPDRSVRLRGLS